MRSKALVMVGLVVSLSAMPGLAAAGAAVEGCFEQMLAEMGWGAEDLAGVEVATVTDELPEPIAVPPSNDLHPCQGRIQPGSQMTIGCTMNFIFQDQFARLYFGTAGHCVGPNQVVGIAGVGAQVGTVVYDGGPAGGQPDFALVRIDPAFYADVDPTMCHWGGPAGVNGAATNGQTTHIYGYGLIYGSSMVTRARPGVVQANPPFVSYNPAIEYSYVGFAQPGDSGSPVMTGDGKAAGVHVRSSLSLGGIRIDPSGKVMTRVDASIAAASAALGLQISLVDGEDPFSLTGGDA